MVGSAIAGLGGALLISFFPVSPFVGANFVIKGFAVAIIGGLGNVTGAVLAALFLGLLESMSQGYFAPAWTQRLCVRPDDPDPARSPAGPAARLARLAASSARRPLHDAQRAP